MTSAREVATRLASLLAHEHSAMADFLVALAEFDDKRLWEQLGHASLFSFLRRDLRLSAGAAQYRKTAAELVQRYPEVEAALRGGRLCLSSVIEVAKVIPPENAAEILPRFFGLSARDAAFVAASIRPVEDPPRRDFIVTPLPAAAGSAQLRTSEMYLTSVTPPAGAAPSAEPAARPHTPVAVVRTSVEPLDADRARVHMTVSRRLLEKLEQARAALSHSHPGAGQDEILEVGLDLIIERHAKRRGLVKSPRKTVSVPQAGADRKRERVPAHVMRAVWKRDGGRCQWPVDGGGICGSTHQVEFDHIAPVARGGPSTEDNGRLLCRPHQDLAARQVYGDGWMDRFTRRRPA
jgi:5-methylcytosine-specific restriction endonuclease McrA